jgi:hypothetical protein
MEKKPKKRRLDAKTKPRWEALFGHVLESQESCMKHGDAMTPSELRHHVSCVNRQFALDLDSYWQEVAAMSVETVLGVKIKMEEELTNDQSTN